MKGRYRLRNNLYQELSSGFERQTTQDLCTPCVESGDQTYEILSPPAVHHTDSNKEKPTPPLNSAVKLSNKGAVPLLGSNYCSATSQQVQQCMFLEIDGPCSWQRCARFSNRILKESGVFHLAGMHASLFVSSECCPGSDSARCFESEATGSETSQGRLPWAWSLTRMVQ